MNVETCVTGTRYPKPLAASKSGQYAVCLSQPPVSFLDLRSIWSRETSVSLIQNLILLTDKQGLAVLDVHDGYDFPRDPARQNSGDSQ